MTTMKIAKGATLQGMVSQYNKTHAKKVTVAQIAKANGIKDPNKIQAGNTLKFPDSFETRKPTTRKTTPTKNNDVFTVGQLDKTPKINTPLPTGNKTGFPIFDKPVFKPFELRTAPNFKVEPFKVK